MNILRDIFFLIGEAKQYFVKIILFVIGMELCRIIGNEFFVTLVNGVVETSTILWPFFIAWLAMALLNWLLDGGADYFVVKLIAGVGYIVPMKSLRHLTTLSMKFFSDAGTGKVAKRIEQGANGLTNLLESFCWEALTSSIQCVITLIYLGWVLLPWGVVLVITSFLLVLATLMLDSFKRLMRKERYDLYESSSHLLFQIMQNIALVKAFAKEEGEIKRYDAMRGRIHDLSIKEFRFEVFFNILRGSIISIALGVVFYIGVSSVSIGLIKVGSIFGAMGLATAALLSLSRLMRIFVRFMDNYEAISRVIEFLKQTPDIVDAPDAIQVDHLQGDIIFDRVHFSYKNPKSEIGDCLVDISFRVPAGKTVAIVGPSGSGKTTLINLLLRFMDPTSGNIYVGDHDIRDLTQDSYRKNLSVVLQDTLLFDRTLGENVAGGLEVVDYRDVSQDIWHALSQAHADDFVKKLADEDALATMIGEKGIKLSGGQRQRVAIAAALVRRPVILILDEATSSLDTQSEKAIQLAMRDLQSKGDTTVFVIAHRLSTIRDADLIMVLEEGRLVQMGSHTDLMKQHSGLYAQMVGVQHV